MASKQSNYKAILFDLGSTLIEYENHDWVTLGKMGIIAGYPYLKSKLPSLPELEEFGTVFYQRFRKLLDDRPDYHEIDLRTACEIILMKFDRDVTGEIVDEFILQYYQPVTEQIALIPGAVEILDLIKRNNLTIGLVSNSIFMQDWHRTEMQRFGLLNYFDFTLFSSALGIRKPGKEIFEIALANAKVKPEEALFIGDRFDADIAGAKNAGIKSVWKQRENRDNPDNLKPDYSIVNLAQLETIIFQ